MNPFEYANDLMVKEGYDEDIEQRKDYKEFLINRSMSYQPDLIHLVNEINRYPDIEKKLHYDFLHNAIPKKKRPRKFWIKGKKLENMELLKEENKEYDIYKVNKKNNLLKKKIIEIISINY